MFVSSLLTGSNTHTYYMNFPNELRHRKIVAYVLAAILALFMVSSPFEMMPQLTDNGPTWLGIDCSFEMVMNYILHHKMVWGKDITTTYGPLACLSNRVLWGIPKGYALLFDAFLAINFWFVFRRFLMQHHLILGTCFLFIVSLLLNAYFGSATAFLLMFFSLFWMHEYVWKSHFGAIVMSSVCVTLCFYMKLNTAFFAVLFFIANLANLYYSGKIPRRQLLLSVLLLLLCLYIPAIYLHVSLPGYIRGGFYIMSGYNELMYLNEKHPGIEVWVRIGLGLVALFFTWQLLRLFREKRWPDLCWSLICLCFVFLTWKQSVLRNDRQHLSEFFSTTALVFLIGNMSAGFEKKKAHYVLAGLVLAALFAGKMQFSTPADLIKDRFTSVPQYIRQVRNYNGTDYQTLAGKRKIPAPLLQQIGRQTIDVFPWDVEYLIQNKLNYLPRPDFQSYMVYNPALQWLNYESYVHNPPQYILYDYDAIDERYPFNDEGITNAFIAGSYSIVDTFTSNERLRLLLKKMPRVAPVNATMVRQLTFGSNDIVDVTGLDFVRISLPYSLRGKLRAFLYKPSELKVQLITRQGEWKTYRTSLSQLGSFIYTGKYIGNTRDFIHLIRGEKEALSDIVKIRLEHYGRSFSDKAVLTGYVFR